MKLSLGSFAGILIFLIAFEPVHHLRAGISYDSQEDVYNQNFDSLPFVGSSFTWDDNGTIAGWYAASSAAAGFNPAGITTGSTTSGDLYSFGASGSSERALGSIGSGATGNFWWGVKFINNTGTIITGFTISYTGEQWRRASAELQTISVEYSLTATELRTGSYQSIPGLTFVSPDTGGSSGARNGNHSDYRASIGPVTVNNINWMPGAALWIRFSDPDHSGNDHGLAIDDFSFSAAGASPNYDAPAGYYSAVQGLTGDALATALRNIIAPHTVIPNDGGSTQLALQVLDEDPLDTGSILLTYSGISVVKTDPNWTLEFLWPRSRGIEQTGPDASDLFNLRAAYVDVVTARSDRIFDFSDPGDAGYVAPAHGLAAGGTSADSDSWEPPSDERGDIARSLFYMDVRYNGSEANTQNLMLENQIEGAEDMAVLSTLLEWHHADPVSEQERLRNHRIFTLYQHNRNPFIDRPEYADLVFGDFVTLSQDIDLDGMPNYWETLHGFDPENPADVREDADGDGFSNYEEYWMGTDPWSASDPVIIYVDASYTGSVQNGSITYPYKTIQAAANAVPDEQARAILVAPGTYLGPYIAGKKKIHIFSEQGADVTIIEANPTNSSVVRLYDFEHASFVGFTVRNAVTTWYGAGLRIDAPQGRILLANNIITNNTTTNVSSGGGGVYLKTGSGSRVVNNIIHGNQAVRGGGVLFAGGNAEFWHNTLVGNTATGGNGGGASAIQGVTPDIRNNILWANAGAAATAQLHQLPGTTFNIVQGVVPGSGNFDTDPLFADPGNQDYRLTHNSPARDAGTALPIAFDMQWNLRPDSSNGQWDLGAYELIPDSDDGLPPGWQEWIAIHFPGVSNVDPHGDADGDGLSNLEEFLAGSDPNNYYSQGTTTIVPVITVVSGNNQSGLPGMFISEPLVVEVTNQMNGEALSNAPITFAVTQGDGYLAATNIGVPEAVVSLERRTDPEGKAFAYYQFPVSSAATTSIVVSADVEDASPATFSLQVSLESSAPEAPSEVDVFDENDGSLKVVWKDNSHNEDNFIIEYLDGIGDWIQIGTAGENQISYSISASIASTLGINSMSALRVVSENSGGKNASDQSSSDPPFQYAIIEVGNGVGQFVDDKGRVAAEDPSNNTRYVWNAGNVSEVEGIHMGLSDNGKLLYYRTEFEESPLAIMDLETGSSVFPARPSPPPIPEEIQELVQNMESAPHIRNVSVALSHEFIRGFAISPNGMQVVSTIDSFWTIYWESYDPYYEVWVSLSGIQLVNLPFIHDGSTWNLLNLKPQPRNGYWADAMDGFLVANDSQIVASWYFSPDEVGQWYYATPDSMPTAVSGFSPFIHISDVNANGLWVGTKEGKALKGDSPLEMAVFSNGRAIAVNNLQTVAIESGSQFLSLLDSATQNRKLWPLQKFFSDDIEWDVASFSIWNLNNHNTATGTARKLGESQSRAVLLLPIEFVVDNQNKIIDPKKEALGVSNWVTTDGLPAESNFTDTCDDPENFRISITAIDPAQTSINAKLEVKRAGSVVETLNYTLDKKDGNRFRSRFLRLVTDDADDAASGHGATSDPNNQTIKVKLGDVLKISYEPVSGQTVESEISVGRPVSENDNGANQRRHDIRELKVRVVVFKNNAGNACVTRAQVEQDIADANERLAQATIKIVPTFDFGGSGDPGVTQPAALNDGYTAGALLNPPNDDEQAVIAFKDNDPNTLDVFYVENLTNSGGRGTSYPKARNLSGDSKYNNWVVINNGSAGGGDPHNLAHEIMHILLNAPHRADPSTALFRGGTDYDKNVNGTKRIGPYPDATAAGVGENDTNTIRTNAEVFP